MDSQQPPMATGQPQHLIKMINQIAANNLHHGDIEAAASLVANHVRKFWARPMKQQIIAYYHRDGSALCATARRAVELLTAPL